MSMRLPESGADGASSPTHHVAGVQTSVTHRSMPEKPVPPAPHSGSQVSWEVEQAVKAPHTVSPSNFTHLPHYAQPQILMQPQTENCDEKIVNDWVVRRAEDRRPAGSFFGDAEQIVRLRAITPRFLTCIVGIQIGLFIVACVAQGGLAPLTINPSIGAGKRVMLDLGAYNPQKIVNGEWWRWLTSTVLPAGFIHCTFNCLAQIPVALFVERAYGWASTATIYVVSGVAGAIVSALAEPHWTTCHSTAALLGLWAVLLVDVLVHWDYHASRRGVALKLTAATFLCTLLLGLLPFLDNFSSLGGAAAGLLLSPTIVPMNALPITRGLLVGGSTSLLLWLMTISVIAVYAEVYPCPSCRYFSCLDINGWCALS